MTTPSANTPMARPRACPIRKSGHFPQSLYDQATKDGWIVVSMKNDWKRIFAFDVSRPDLARRADAFTSGSAPRPR